jgi:hypothetical protein
MVAPPPPAYPYPYPYPAVPPVAAYPTTAVAPPAETLTATPPPGRTRMPAADPQADRGVLLPTAYTHPKGTYYVTDYEIVLVQVGYALTDDTQLSLTAVPPLGAERIAFIDFTLKTSLYRGGLVRVAALGSTSGVVAKEIGVLGVGRVGGVVQLCLQTSCDSSLSISSNVTLAGVMLMANGVSGIFRLGRTVSLLVELDTLVPLGRELGELNGAMAGGGVRWHGTHWGFDFALMRVLGGDQTTLPVLALTYRSD